MGWDAEDAALLKKLWAVGQSAAQLARRLERSRNAVCAKLTRLGLKRGHKLPTAKPKIRPVPKPALLAACARPVDRIVSTRKPGVTQPEEFTKSQLKAMLAEAADNTARHVVVQSFLGGFDPRFEAIALPTLYLDQHNPRGLHEQNAQVAIAAP